MMEAADHGRLNDPALVEALHRSRVRSVFGEGEVGPGTVVVGEVRVQQAVEVDFVHHHDVAEALAAQGANEAFHVRILPRRPRRRFDLADP